MESAREDKWKTFLSSIDHFKKLPTKNLEIKTKSDIGCLATTFAAKLLLKEAEKQGDLDETIDNNESSDDDENSVNETDTDEEVNETDTDEEVNEVSAQFDNATIKEESKSSEASNHMKALAGNTPLASGKGHHRRHRNNHTLLKEIPSSKWNISNIAEYFIFDECVTEFKVPTMPNPCTDNTFESAEEDIFRRLKMVKGIDLNAEGENANNDSLIQLKSVTHTEAGSRLVVDALLSHLHSACALEIELEKNISCDFLPNCTLDYCIRKGKHIIGCIETKSVKSLSDRSVAQAVLQLMILQAALMAPETPKVDISEFPVFAIVTDGHRFIYIQLKGSFLKFEHDGDTLRIRKVTKEGDFKDILHHIHFLVKEAVSHIVNTH